MIHRRLSGQSRGEKKGDSRHRSLRSSVSGAGGPSMGETEGDLPSADPLFTATKPLVAASEPDVGSPMVMVPWVTEAETAMSPGQE